MKKDLKKEAIFPIADQLIRFTNNNFITAEKDFFLLTIQSGQTIAAQYAYTPKHFKQLSLRMKEVIEQYESKNGNIDPSDDKTSV